MLLSLVRGGLKLLWVQITLLALAVSLDSFVVGMSYGFRRVTLGATRVALIAFLSALLKMIAMLFGRSIVGWVSPETAPAIGGIVLIGLGLWFLAAALFARDEGAADEGSGEQDDRDPHLMTLRFRPLGIVVKVLQDPAAFDVDDSSSIGLAEAVLLGFALGCDAMGAGISAGFLQLPIVPAVGAVAVGTVVFLSTGMIAGSRLGKELTARPARALPGAILVALGAFTWLTG